MSLLVPELQQKISSVFNVEDVITDLDFAKTQLYQVTDPLKIRAESFLQYKTHIFGLKGTSFVNACELKERRPVDTSFNFLFGGPFFRGEVTSIEGGPGVGKTRLCLNIAHEFHNFGKVLYVDADFSLTPNIISNVFTSINLPTIPISQLHEDSVPDNQETFSFHMSLCSNPTELFDAINLYIRNATPDLIIVDSAISLFQSMTMKDGPGSAMLQEFAIEFKRIVQEMDCVGIVTNALRTDPGAPPVPFLGRIYASLWHQRLLMSSKAFFCSKCELVASPRYPYQSVNLTIQSITQTPDDSVTTYESI